MMFSDSTASSLALRPPSMIRVAKFANNAVLRHDHGVGAPCGFVFSLVQFLLELSHGPAQDLGLVLQLRRLLPRLSRGPAAGGAGAGFDTLGQFGGVGVTRRCDAGQSTLALAFVLFKQVARPLQGFPG